MFVKMIAATTTVSTTSTTDFTTSSPVGSWSTQNNGKLFFVLIVSYSLAPLEYINNIFEILPIIDRYQLQINSIISD